MIAELEVEIDDVTRTEVNDLTTEFINSGFRIDSVTVKDHYKVRKQRRSIHRNHFANLPRREGEGEGEGGEEGEDAQRQQHHEYSEERSRYELRYQVRGNEVNQEE